MDTIKIIGAGLSGLLTAYHLLKENKDLQIEIVEGKDKKVENASAYSLAWLNARYPSKDMPNAIRSQKECRDAKLGYDLYRLKSLQTWHSLCDTLKKDGITDILATQKEHIVINDQAINAISVFFNPACEWDYIHKIDRLKHFSMSYKTKMVQKDKLAHVFPFIARIKNIYKIHNISEEQLVNPKTLREKLIHFLEKSGVKFRWNTIITPDMIQSEPNTEWILAAGNGCIHLVSKTILETQPFCEKSVADIIECTLKEPFNLHGKVFYFAASKTTPAFHLRNDELNQNAVKIIIASQGGKSRCLKNDAQSIFKLLKLNVKKFHCVDTIDRPMTPDGRPLVAACLGPHKNIHMVYGHSLFTNGAKLYPDFARHLAHIMAQKQKKSPIEKSYELEQLNAENRFQNPPNKNHIQPDNKTLPHKIPSTL